MKLPEILQSIVDAMKSKRVKDSIEFYKRFCCYTNEDTVNSNLGILEYINENENDLIEYYQTKENSEENKKRYEMLNAHIVSVFSSLDSNKKQENEIVWEIQLEDSSTVKLQF